MVAAVVDRARRRRAVLANRVHRSDQSYHTQQEMESRCTAWVVPMIMQMAGMGPAEVGVRRKVPLMQRQA